MSRHTADCILRMHKDGGFLVRASETFDGYTLSARSPQHYNIVCMLANYPAVMQVIDLVDLLLSIRCSTLPFCLHSKFVEEENGFVVGMSSQYVTEAVSYCMLHGIIIDGEAHQLRYPISRN